MQVEWQVAAVSEWRAEALIFYVFENASEPLPGFKRWLQENGTWLTQSAALRDFRGKFKDAAVCYGPSEVPVTRLVLVGTRRRHKRPALKPAAGPNGPSFRGIRGRRSR